MDIGHIFIYNEFEVCGDWWVIYYNIEIVHVYYVDTFMGTVQCNGS